MKRLTKLAVLVILLIILSACRGSNEADADQTQIYTITEPADNADVQPQHEPTPAVEPMPEPEPTPAPEITPEPPTIRPTQNHGAIRDITAMEFVQDIRVGWNLGNTLDAYAEWGNNTNAETAWVSRLTTRDMIDAIAHAGFNILRLPVTWTTGTGNYRRVGPSPYYTIEPWFLARVEEIANWALDNDMYVIINAHHDAWKYRVGPESLAQDRDMITSLWTQIATHFRDYCDRLIFLTMNEPQGERHNWLGTDEHREYVNVYNQLIVDTIRATGGNNETRFVMVPTLSGGAAYEHFRDFRLPSDMHPHRLIASVHSYAPTRLTFGYYDTHAEFDNDGRGDIDWLWHTIDQRFIQQDIPVILGEFGSQNKHNEAERAAHARYFVAGGRQLGIPSIWWDNYLFESANPYHERFGLFDRGALEFRFPLIWEAIMEGVNER